uniref:Peptidase S72 domain-containing protein n=1 Tax=Strongyloides papillosus TaxID=174720 RepID=A0A0N5B510_STREA
MKLRRGKKPSNYILKYLYCHDNGVKTFVKCGYLKQKFLPSIDVGYQCDDYNEDEANRIHNRNEKLDMISLFNDELMCKDVFVNELPTPVIAFLPPGYNYDSNNTFKLDLFDTNTKLYSGHGLHYVNEKDFFNKILDIERCIGYAINYEPKCTVPHLKATLRLKINGIVQEFQNKIDNNFGKIDSYVVNRREIKDAQISCHAVLEETKHPALNDFYEYRFSTLLSMLDETTKHYIEVNNTHSLVSNRKYRCTLKDVNSKSEKPTFITETEFIIDLTEEYSYIWIIFGVFIAVTVLLIIGFIVLKKLKFKIKKSNSSTLTTSSQSTNKSLTAISEGPNPLIIKEKNTDKTRANLEKMINNKNLNTNNKLISFEQKVVGKNSNLNLINEAKNAPKKVSGKDTNQKKISNMNDSVFKVK